MKLKKHIKDSPSAAAFSSPEKRRIISELVAARNNIKSKFKRAYTDRMKREHEFKQAFKPITSAISTLKSEKKSKKKKNENLDDVESSGSFDEPFETRPFKPKRFASSTPHGILNKKRLSYSPSEIFNTAGEFSGTRRERTPTPPPTPFTRSPHKTRSRVKNVDSFTYEVKGDNDNLNNYDYFPSDDISVDVTRTDTNSGAQKHMRMKYSDLPMDAKKKWIKKRQNMARIHQEVSHSVKSKSQIFNDDDDDFDDTDDEGGAKSLALLTKKKRGRGIKSSSKLLDFNFIPYNVNNRIIYEYFDDPNELCDRLRLLVSSKRAGNSNHMQEINSIIEELRELKCIV